MRLTFRRGQDGRPVIGFVGNGRKEIDRRERDGDDGDPEEESRRDREISSSWARPDSIKKYLQAWGRRRVVSDKALELKERAERDTLTFGCVLISMPLIHLLLQPLRLLESSRKSSDDRWSSRITVDVMKASVEKGSLGCRKKQHEQFSVRSLRDTSTRRNAPSASRSETRA